MTQLTADTPLGDSPGQGLIRADIVGTVVFLLVTVAASFSDGNAANLANIAVSSVLFLGGCIVFGIGFVRAAGRSRTEIVDMTGLFYLTGTAPRAVRRAFLGLWFLQIAVAVVSVFTVAPPFGVMAPLWGIGLTAAWGARHGTFTVRSTNGSRTDGSAPQ